MLPLNESHAIVILVCVCFILLRITSSRCTHVIACVGISLRRGNILLHIYILFIHSPANKTLGFFHVLVIANDVSMTMGVYLLKFLLSVLWGLCPEELRGHTVMF